MIKLKLNREQLYTVCTFTNPAIIEAKISHCLHWQEFNELDTLFNIIQIGEIASKKWLFTNKNKNNLSLKYAEGASLLKYTDTLLSVYEELSYEYNLIIMLRQELHQQLTNFQRRFYDRTKQSGLIGGNSHTQSPDYQLAGSSDRRAINAKNETAG